MATTVPETIGRSATAGERLLFRTLKNYLPEDYIVYYEPEIHGKCPDIVVVGPDVGLIVLEVKDYTKNTLFRLNQDEWTLLNANGEHSTVQSPVKQARDYTFNIMNALQRDKELTQAEGKYKHRLKFPCGYGTVFTRLHQKDFIEHGLYSIIEPSLSFARDEIDPDREGFSEENLMEKLTNMFIVPFRLKEPLSKDEIDHIRFILFPEVRISAEYTKPAPYQDDLLLSLHDMKTMDLHQENLAKQIGDKNRLIRGVAGSGKTLILASRAKLLAKQHPDWKILILCYNISLASYIQQMIHHMMQEPDDLFDYDFSDEESSTKKGNDQVEVFNFHQWLSQKLKTKSEDDIPNLIDSIEKDETAHSKYDAILIDEGQDFKGEWFKLVSQMLNPETKSLLLVEDRAQSIYKRKRSYVQDTGLDFTGRSKILNINYRNTAQIVKFAWDFYQNQSSLKSKIVKKGTEEEIIAPQSTRRKGPEPTVYRVESFSAEAKMVAEKIKELHTSHKLPLSECLILYRVKSIKKEKYVEDLKRDLKKEEIPYDWVTENKESKREFSKDEETVKISTIDSSKGLDFQTVFIVNLDNMPFHLEEDKEREASLLYIGMTRAKDYLCLTYSGDSEFTDYFDSIVEKDHQQIESKAYLES